MTSKEIVDAVTSYVRDENVKYAILIDGALCGRICQYARCCSSFNRGIVKTIAD